MSSSDAARGLGGHVIDGGITTEGLRIPRLDGRGVSLRPLVPEDYAYVRQQEMGSEIATRWRLGGATPSPEAWHHALWQGVIAQFLAIDTATSRPLGLVAAYQPNFQHRFAYLAASRFGDASRVPLVVSATVLFVNYVFACWDFAKLYLEVPEYNWFSIASGEGRYFVTEGRLKGHLYQGGRRWDQYTLAIHRDVWATRDLSAFAPSDLGRSVTIRLPGQRPIT